MSESDVPARCAPYEEDLSAWLDHELDPTAAAVVRDHVEGCARCAARVEELRAVDQGLRAMAASAPSASEAARLARMRARLAAEQAQLQPLPERATEPGEVAAASAASAPRPRRAAPARRRRLLPAALLAAAAAVLVSMLALPPLLERVLSTTEDELMAQGSEERLAPAAAPVPAPAAEAPPAVPEARLAERLAVRPPPTTPGHLGASAEPGTSADSGAAPLAPIAPAARARAARGAANDDELDLALALDELEGVEPGDLAVVERLGALERMAEERAEGGSD